MWGKENKLYKVFCGFGASCVKSNKLPQVIKFEAEFVGAEEFENE